MELIVNNVNLGEIEDNIAEQICKKYNGQDISEIAIRVMHDLIDDDSEDMAVEELIKRARFEKNNRGYDTIAEMVSYHMRRDLRPANEICKNCESYNNHFCVYQLREVNPFSKGNTCWNEKQKMDNVTHIAEGYVKYGKEVEYPDDYKITEMEELVDEDNLISFSRPRWIVKEGEPEEIPSMADLNDMLNEVMKRDPEELRAELDKEASEYDEGIEISADEAKIINDNMDRFVEVSGHLYAIWRTARRYGIFSMRNVTEETTDTKDPVIAYINDRVEDIIEGELLEKMPPDPLGNTIEDILTAYSNYILSGISGAANPNRMKTVVRCFVDEDSYREVMGRIEAYTNRYDWLKEKE